MIVFIPTLGREGKQVTINHIPERWKDRVFLVCPEEETHEWENRINVPRECIGSISKTRQFIVENSPSPFVGMMDDDLSIYKRDSKILTRSSKMEDIGEFLDLMESWLVEGDVYCSCSNSFMSHEKDDEYYYGKPSATHFLNRDFMLALNIKFDTLNYFEDFHVPLSVLEKGRRLRITGKYFSKERKANAPGGCSTTRTSTNNRQAMIDLKKLHDRYVSLKEEPGATNQSIDVGLKMRIAFKKAYEENVMRGTNIESLFD